MVMKARKSPMNSNVICGPVSYTHLDVYKRQMLPYKETYERVKLFGFSFLPLSAVMKKEKYYVVWAGVNPGIYTSRTDCQLDVYKRQ